MRDSNAVGGQADEMDIVEIIAVFWTQKWLIVSITVIAVLAAAAFAFLSQPVYEAKYIVSPPAMNDVANLNYGRSSASGLTPFTVKEVYDVFLSNLQSETMRQSFFEKVYIPSLGEKNQKKLDGNLYDEFFKRLTIAPVGKDMDGRWAVSLQDSSPGNAVAWVNAYVVEAGEIAKREVIRNASTEASVRARNLKSQIETLHETGRKVREDTTSRLHEALKVAKSIGLEKPLIFTGNQSAVMSGDMAGSLTYMRGSKALEAELKNLEARESDDPFIDGLRDLEAKLAYYKGLEEVMGDISVYRQDGAVEQPGSSIKPKKALILILGTIAGGVLGSIIALMRHFIRRRTSTS